MTELRGFKFVTTLVLVFKKIESDGNTSCDTFYSNWKAETIINESGVDDVFESIYKVIILNMQKSFGRGWDWIIDSVIHHNISISFPFKIRDILKMFSLKNNSIGISVFGYENKKKHPICVSIKCGKEKQLIYH